MENISPKHWISTWESIKPYESTISYHKPNEHAHVFHKTSTALTHVIAYWNFLLLKIPLISWWRWVAQRPHKVLSVISTNIACVENHDFHCQPSVVGSNVNMCYFRSFSVWYRSQYGVTSYHFACDLSSNNYSILPPSDRSWMLRITVKSS